MCGIFGAPSDIEFETLYSANKKRGTFSFGCTLITTNETYVTYKQEGLYDTNSDTLNYKDINYYLGHTQAPTSCEREYRSITTHPFEEGDWQVAHNGVLSNFDHLKSKYVPWHTSKVDTSIIPALLNEFRNEDNNASAISLLTRVANLLEGTFALWILDKMHSHVYLLRSGSTLFLDPTMMKFSSVEFNEWEEVQEGIIYQYTTEGFTQVSTFESKCPFFMF